MGLAVMGFAEAYARTRPDLLLVLGDRFEMHAAALAALPFRIPVAHVHGGELTRGAMDDALRHSMTKLSHLHFVSTEEHARRVVQLGEEPWRVQTCGAPSLDLLRDFLPMPREAFAAEHGFRPPETFLLATFHPETLARESAEAQAGELLAALDELGLPVVFTYPNADAAGRSVLRALHYIN
jgi:UDP-hydrolysing UDP-N-acetyl-D-glucosamine 2-epimerase